MSAFDDIRAAFATLTVMPVGKRSLEIGPRSVGWYALVGAVLGAVPLFGLAALNSASWAWGDSEFIVRGAPVLAALTVGFWACSTRLLHWDGLADVADALGAAHDPQARLEVMKDSHVGAFGVAVVVFVALTQIAALTVAMQDRSGMGWVVLGAPVTGRLAAAFAAWFGAPARSDGLGAAIIGRPRVGGVLATVAVWSAVLGAYVFEIDVLGGVLFGASALVALVVPHLLSRSFRGVTGDVIGASVLVTETIVLVAAALIGAWA